MKDIDYNKERALAEEKIRSDAFDFTAKYLAVAELHGLAETHPEVLNRQTVALLEDLMKHTRFARQRQGFFLFRETSNTLGALIANRRDKETAGEVLSAFKRILAAVTEHAHRASAEALGALPVSVKGPQPPKFESDRLPTTSFDKVMDAHGIRSVRKPVFFGRSLVFSCEKDDRLLVFKLARPSDTPEGLANEILWMEHIRSGGQRFSSRFEIPQALFVNESPVFRFKQTPPENGMRLHHERFAIAFTAHRDYFTYPNAPETARKLSGDAFSDILLQNAFLAGRLAADGVVHSALIPLFHNRVQTGRRRDQGLYEWFRAGRLDQWLRSCDHPNLGVTGLRDFEHLFSYDQTGLSLYRHMGSQFLSFFLVAGSYFRNKDEKRVGLDENGKPVDARGLFDPEILKKLISGVFQRYYRGFVGIEYEGGLPFDIDRLADRMIEEMGVDRYMEEFLRVADQNQMSDDEFHAFLKSRGFDPEKILEFIKGEQDIAIMSGPHLGGFNESISLPELIEAVASMAGVCIAGKFWKEKFHTGMCM